MGFQGYEDDFAGPYFFVGPIKINLSDAPTSQVKQTALKV